MDFTLKTYCLLLAALKKRGYTFLTYSDYIENSSSLVKTHSSQVTSHPSLCILRHDVDRLPGNSIVIAKIEAEFEIKGTYYFRIVPESFDLDIMKRIAALGHEIGYHYEDIDLTTKNEKLKIKNEKDKEYLIDKAYESFCKNLDIFRKNFDIKTICMHGSPRSKHDNKIIWSQRNAFGRKYNYKDLGIIGEPYYDIDFNEFAYFTDTGRRWNGSKVSIRDKVNSKYNFNYKTTQQIIDNIEKLPNKLMFTIHTHRWFDFGFMWTRELIVQNIINVIKYFIVRRK